MELVRKTMTKLILETPDHRKLTVSFGYKTFSQTPFLSLEMESLHAEVDQTNRKELTEITKAYAWAKSKRREKGLMGLISRVIGNSHTDRLLLIEFTSKSDMIWAIESIHFDVETPNNKKQKNKKKLFIRNDDNDKFQELIRFKNQLCDKKNRLSILPEKRTEFSHLTIYKTPDKSEKRSHDVTIMRKKGKNNQTKTYFYKDTAETPGKIPQIEAALAAAYCAILGPGKAPKAKLLVDKNESKGIISKEIPGFTSFHDFMLDKYSKYELKAYHDYYHFISNYDYTGLVDVGIVEILAASYFFEENDLHWKNWGFDASGQAVRIDFDQSLWTLTSKHSGYAIAEEDDKFHGIAPRNAFQITQADIETFPQLTNAKPNNWIVGHDSNLVKKIIKDLKNHPDFSKRKWIAFLKIILMPDEMITKICLDYIGKEKSAKKYAQHIIDRKKTLKETLLAIPEFESFIINDGPIVIKNIVAEMEKYNKTVKPNLQYHLDKAQIEFTKLRLNLVDANRKIYNEHRAKYQNLPTVDELREDAPLGEINEKLLLIDNNNINQYQLQLIELQLCTYKKINAYADPQQNIFEILTKLTAVTDEEKAPLLSSAVQITDEETKETASKLLKKLQIKASLNTCDRNLNNYKQALEKNASLKENRKNLLPFPEKEISALKAQSFQDDDSGFEKMLAEIEKTNTKLTTYTALVTAINALATAVSSARSQLKGQLATALKKAQENVADKGENLYKRCSEEAVAILKQSNPNLEEIELITRTLTIATKCVENPSHDKPEVKQLHDNAKALSGKSSISKKIAGGALMLVGALLMAAATTLLISSLVFAAPSFGASLLGIPLFYPLLGLGSALIAGGSGGIFLFSGRQKGLSKSAADLVQAAKAIPPQKPQ